MLRYTDEHGNTFDKVDTAIRRLKTFEPEGGYFLAFSGGKDSQCIYHLAKMAEVKFDAHYNVTSVDPPELVHFIKSQYPDVIFDYPTDKNGKRITMWSLIAQHTMPPTRKVRYCCEHLKEANGKGRVAVLGVRWAESPRRRRVHGVASITTQSRKLFQKALETNPTARIADNERAIIMNDDNDEARRMVEMCYRTKEDAGKSHH